MAKEIKWTPESETTFAQILNYLQNNWTEKEVRNFVQATNRTLFFISEHPLMYRKSESKSVREALITEHNLLLYRVKSKHIELITFFDTRRHPKKKGGK